ncbi:restriction endonuclease subunit S [Pseudomonas monteilii]|uniref:Restriction endonuclease subunit S n=1 Tax=Pseudomonas monteilii TaxID=76759 RepID=A0A399M1D5_9PSED|nr:restriction endonuclease subunit S [Pseudomonas monteilii]RII75055.1 restriction endonuclease subunit S [Pseudomonas monteilii]
MYTVRIHSQLEDRLDAEFYNPEALKTVQKIDGLGKTKRLGQLIADGYRVVYHGTDSINGIPEEKLLSFLSPTQIDDQGSIDFSAADKLPLYYKDDYPKGLAVAGELLIEVKGNVSKVGVVPEAFPKHLMVSGSLYKASFNADTNSRYVLAFLKSKHGQVLKNRLTSNTIINYIAKDALYSIPLFAANSDVQKYIGNKVRQAEHLRAWAKELRLSVDMVLDQLCLPTTDVPSMVNCVSTERLEARLDPRPYRTHYINLVDQIKAIKHSCVSDVAKLASGCPVSSSDFIEGGEVPLVRIRNIGFDEFIDLDTGVAKELHKEEAKYQAKENMIVLGMDGIFRAQFFLSDELPMLVNQRVGMITANDIRAELLTHWLNRPEGQMQLNQWAVKTTVEHTSLSDIGRVRIPRLNADVEDDLADKLLAARRAYRYSRFLTTSASLLVEALIEGRLTEAELLTAEKALQAGNDRLDRFILRRLNTGGIDGQGPALFGDLDEIYHLLTQAEGD